MILQYRSICLSIRDSKWKVCLQKYWVEPPQTNLSCAWLYVGIMLLEKQLLQMEDDGPSSHKRARTSSSPPTKVTTAWIELSK